jgi:hypothetical protein
LAANLVQGPFCDRKKYPNLSVTRFFLWNVVSVSVTVSAESIGQFGNCNVTGKIYPPYLE